MEPVPNVASEPPMPDLASAPSLASAMPAGLLRRLDRRKSRIPKGDSGELEAPQPSTPGKAVAPADKENGAGTTPQRAGTTPQRAGTPGALGTPGGTPSRCVVEVERLRQRREEKRMLHDRVRADLAGSDEQQEFRVMIEGWRRENEARLLQATPSGGEAVRPFDAARLSVCVRKRPLLPVEKGDGDLDVLSLLGSGGAVLHETRRRVDLTRTLDNHEFELDECFCEADTNNTIYSRVCRPLVHAAFDGRHSTVFAFGQTGSGKTHTFEGGEGEDAAGLYALAAGECFAILQCAAFACLSVSCSFYEIYREAAFDLMPVLSPRSTPEQSARAAEEGGAPGYFPGAPVKLPVLEDANGEVQLVGLCEHSVESTAAVLRLLREAQAARRTGNNSIHQRSSRSHALMQLFLRDRASGALHGKLTLVDLAGSERAADTLDGSRQSRTEGADINRPLLCLKECVACPHGCSVSSVQTALAPPPLPSLPRPRPSSPPQVHPRAGPGQHACAVPRVQADPHPARLLHGCRLADRHAGAPLPGRASHRAVAQLSAVRRAAQGGKRKEAAARRGGSARRAHAIAPRQLPTAPEAGGD
jgi:hypothetical protein